MHAHRELREALHEHRPHAHGRAHDLDEAEAAQEPILASGIE
jgi:hypothetical protein